MLRTPENSEDMICIPDCQKVDIDMRQQADAITIKPLPVPGSVSSQKPALKRNGSHAREPSQRMEPSLKKPTLRIERDALGFRRSPRRCSGSSRTSSSFSGTQPSVGPDESLSQKISCCDRNSSSGPTYVALTAALSSPEDDPEGELDNTVQKGTNVTPEFLLTSNMFQKLLALSKNVQSLLKVGSYPASSTESAVESGGLANLKVAMLGMEAFLRRVVKLSEATNASASTSDEFAECREILDFIREFQESLVAKKVLLREVLLHQPHLYTPCTALMQEAAALSECNKTLFRNISQRLQPFT